MALLELDDPAPCGAHARLWCAPLSGGRVRAHGFPRAEPYGISVDAELAGDGGRGGAPGALRTPFNQAAGAAMASGRCEFEHGALAATGLTSTTGYDYLLFPSLSGSASPLMVAGDFMGLFTSNPDARRFLSYLASDEAQALWVRQPGASHVLCFGANDMMPPDMSAAFTQAVLEYVGDHSLLRELLRGLQRTQQGAGPSQGAASACAQP